MHTPQPVDMLLLRFGLRTQLTKGPGKRATFKKTGGRSRANTRRVLIVCQGTNEQINSSSEFLCGNARNESCGKHVPFGRFRAGSALGFAPAGMTDLFSELVGHDTRELVYSCLSDLKLANVKVW